MASRRMNEPTDRKKIPLEEKKKTRKKWTKYIMEKEKTKGRIKKEGRVRVREKKWLRKGEIKEAN